MRDRYLSEVWRLGMAASRFALTRRGFTAQQTERLIALKIRYERGQFGFLSTDEKRLGFGAG